VGPGQAAELPKPNSDIIDAPEAALIGLVREVVPHDDLQAAAGALARPHRIAVNPPLACAT